MPGTSGGFELITGNDAQVLPVLQSGGDGAIIAMASVFPKQCQQLWDCYYAGELEQARRIQRMLLKLRGLVRSVMPVMATKDAGAAGLPHGAGPVPLP